MIKNYSRWEREKELGLARRRDGQEMDMDPEEEARLKGEQNYIAFVLSNGQNHLPSLTRLIKRNFLSDVSEYIIYLLHVDVY